MHLKKQYVAVIFLNALSLSYSILPEENSKDLPTNYNYDLLARKRRPSSGGGGAGCNFNGVRGKPKTDATGRTFFDLQFINVGYNYNYDINCGGGGTHPAAGGENKPGEGGGILGGGINKPFQKPHKPLLGGIFNQGGHESGDDHQGFWSNRPLLSAIFGQSQSQTQTQSGVLSEAVSGIAGLLPKPQDIGQGLGEGISSFITTLPQIGQSFQSLLPSFGNFQFPTLPSLPQSQGSHSTPIPPPTPGSVTPVGPDPVTEPPDPDDIIYNDSIKPVHEDHDPVTDPHVNNKLPPGAYFNRNSDQIRYQSTKNYQNQRLHLHVNQNQFHYQRNRYPYGQSRNQYRQYESREEEERPRGRSFRFPT